MVTNTTILKEDVERYDTSALALTYSEVSYKRAKRQETSTTDIILLEDVFIKNIRTFVERVMSILTIEDIARAIEKAISDFYLFDEIRLEGIEPLPLEWTRRRYPEIIELSRKLKNNEELTKIDEWNLNEIVRASGWNKNDIMEDLINIDVDPSEREEEYWNLFEKYYKEAGELKSKGDDLQAAEKLWGVITALVKAYAAKKGVIVEHWSRGRLDRFVANNVEKDLKEKFEDLLTYGSELHEHFYEKRLPREKFERRWNQCVELIKEIRASIST